MSELTLEVSALTLQLTIESQTIDLSVTTQVLQLGQLVTQGGGSGNVVGPVSSVAGHLAVFADITGELLEDGGAGPKPYSAQTSAAGTVAVLAATTYLRLTGSGQTANLPALSMMTEGDTLKVKACAGLLASPHTLTANGTDKIFDVDPTAASVTLDDPGSSFDLIAQVALGFWETV